MNGATGALSKVGTGTLTLTGTNGYTGDTTISGGALALTGTGSIAQSVLVNRRSRCRCNVRYFRNDVGRIDRRSRRRQQWHCRARQQDADRHRCVGRKSVFRRHQWHRWATTSPAARRFSAAPTATPASTTINSGASLGYQWHRIDRRRARSSTTAPSICRPCPSAPPSSRWPEPTANSNLFLGNHDTDPDRGKRYLRRHDQRQWRAHARRRHRDVYRLFWLQRRDHDQRRHPCRQQLARIVERDHGEYRRYADGHRRRRQHLDRRRHASRRARARRARR